MESIKLNETPVRTSRNYQINNIKLENVEFPKQIESFNNVKMIGQSDKVKVENMADTCKLTYGLSEVLVKQVNEKANQNLTLTIDSKINQEMQIGFKFDEKNIHLIENIQIIANENAKATVIIKYESKENIQAFHNGVIRVQAKKGSQINVIVANLMNITSNHFVTMENNVEENAKVKYTIIDFGGKNSISNYYCNLVGESSNNILNTIYLGKENQVFDLNYIAELRGAKSNIDIEAQGALKDVSKKHFKGTIDFKKGCKKATGNENENCMLLSDTAKSIALPMLLCSEEEVEGNHSSSAGKIGDKELFYIMARGFEKKEAMKLMVRAKFNKILENIKNEELKNQVLEEIDKRLD